MQLKRIKINVDIARTLWEIFHRSQSGTWKT